MAPTQGKFDLADHFHFFLSEFPAEGLFSGRVFAERRERRDVAIAAKRVVGSERPEIGKN